MHYHLPLELSHLLTTSSTTRYLVCYLDHSRFKTYESKVHVAYIATSMSTFRLCELKNLQELYLSHNMFERNLPHCFNSLSSLKLLDISSNQFTGTLPPSLITNLTSLEYVDFSDNKFEENNFNGSIPKQLCQLSNVSLIDLSGNSNSISGPIPGCLQNIISPINPVFTEETVLLYESASQYYQSVMFSMIYYYDVQFTIKTHSHSYKGHILDLMVGLDLSCNKLVGEIPKELGLLTQIHSLNLSHNRYEGNPLLCGPPLEKKCTSISQATDPSGKEGLDKWYEIDMVSFYGSCGATRVVFLLGFVGVVYINPYWRRSKEALDALS
ncbi:Leucine-rich repeat, typical subtype [Cynara cardunculus var. scolymus]|uniref:Leucine-rich repeat, typical subtype n=1 Tax=Cynara cardunculus var. scolymus TaxID=59895 RepID=A0A103XW95_CYNCS|nr:Leucine-rich repeat, typical subtype [Cynara cardunculus var. scolymus]